MIDLETETLLTLDQARHLPVLQKDGKAPHIVTIYGWTTHGLGGVVLETRQVGGSRRTSREAVNRWIERRSLQREPGRPTPSERSAQSTRTAAVLAAAGI